MIKVKVPKNSNYAAVVTKINKLIPLENCDNVQAAIIMGNQVIVSKSIKIGDVGLYFPLETQLSHEYVSKNNLYRHSDLNENKEEKGYIEDNRRVRAMRFRGNKSEGLFMPLSSLSFVLEDSYKELEDQIGTEFDELKGVSICTKYVVKVSKTPGMGSGKKRKVKKSKIVENQFRFHEDTGMLYKNLHRIKPEDLIQISYKLHGTSGISSKVLCKKKLSIWNKIGQFLGFNVVNAEYDYVYSSRKVIKNPELNPNANHFYKSDIWGLAHNQLKDFLSNGMTVYYEVVGFLPNGGSIQKEYDYGCNDFEFQIYIYRITYTNSEGKVFEFSTQQVRQWCSRNGVKSVPELFYGKARDFFYDGRLTEDSWREKFLEEIKSKFNEKDCLMCRNIVPEEGCVVRKESLEFEAYKAKSNRFYERETKLLDKGEENIEDLN